RPRLLGAALGAHRPGEDATADHRQVVELALELVVEEIVVGAARGPEPPRERGRGLLEKIEHAHRGRPYFIVSGSCFRISWRTSSVFTPSASTSKLSSTRWRSAGSATARMSSIDAAKRPSNSARIFPASSSAWAPRGDD